MTETKLCRRCDKPVVVSAEQYDVFEQMHWLCFHLEFEHEGDPDKPCQDPSCPWWHIEVFKGKLEEMGVDTEKVMKEAIFKRWGFVYSGPTRQSSGPARKAVQAAHFYVERPLLSLDPTACHVKATGSSGS